MYSNSPVNVFAKQLLAWSAIAMLFVQPSGLNGNVCGCGAANGQMAATDRGGAAGVAAKPCDSAKSTCCSAKTTCCSAGSERSNTPCRCGDRCRCSANEPGKPLPAAPVNESQTERTQTLVLTISVVPIVISRTDSKFGLHSYSVYRPAHTAQQTCALLSRFIV